MLVFGREREREQKKCCFRLNGQPIYQANEFVCLGRKLTNNGKSR